MAEMCPIFREDEHFPVGTDQEQALVKLVKTERGLEKKILTGCTFVPLIGRGGWTTKEKSS